MAQRITRLTTDQKIPGSNPGALETFFNASFRLFIGAGEKAEQLCKRFHTLDVR